MGSGLFAIEQAAVQIRFPAQSLINTIVLLLKQTTHERLACGSHLDPQATLEPSLHPIMHSTPGYWRLTASEWIDTIHAGVEEGKPKSPQAPYPGSRYDLRSDGKAERHRRGRNQEERRVKAKLGIHGAHKIRLTGRSLTLKTGGMRHPRNNIRV